MPRGTRRRRSKQRGGGGGGMLTDLPMSDRAGTNYGPGFAIATPPPAFSHPPDGRGNFLAMGGGSRRRRRRQRGGATTSTTSGKNTGTTNPLSNKDDIASTLKAITDKTTSAALVQVDKGLSGHDHPLASTAESFRSQFASVGGRRRRTRRSRRSRRTRRTRRTRRRRAGRRRRRH